MPDDLASAAGGVFAAAFAAVFADLAVLDDLIVPAVRRPGVTTTSAQRVSVQAKMRTGLGLTYRNGVRVARIPRLDVTNGDFRISCPDRHCKEQRSKSQGDRYPPSDCFSHPELPRS